MKRLLRRALAAGLLAGTVLALSIAVPGLSAPAGAETRTACLDAGGKLPTLGSGTFVTAVFSRPFTCPQSSSDNFGNNSFEFTTTPIEGTVVCSTFTKEAVGSFNPPTGFSFTESNGVIQCARDKGSPGFPAAEFPLNSFKLRCDICPRVGAVVNAAGANRSATLPRSASPDVTVRDFRPGIAIEAQSTLYGTRLADTTETATGSSCRTVLGNRQVRLRGPNSSFYATACLTYVSPTQINFYLQADGRITTGKDSEGRIELYDGAGNKQLLNGTGDAKLNVRRVQPGIFTTNGAASGTPAGYLVRVRNGAVTYEAIPANGPIKLGNDQVFLVLQATGIRNADPGRFSVVLGGSCNDQTCSGGRFVNEQYVGPDGGNNPFGLDQVNVELPHDIVGREVLAWLSVDEPERAPQAARFSNVVKLWIEP